VKLILLVSQPAKMALCSVVYRKVGGTFCFWKKFFYEIEETHKLNNHVTNDMNVCYGCNKDMATVGLLYEICGNENVVSGIGSATSVNDIFIATTYNNKPVTSIAEYSDTWRNEKNRLLIGCLVL